MKSTVIQWKVSGVHSLGKTALHQRCIRLSLRYFYTNEVYCRHSRKDVWIHVQLPGYFVCHFIYNNPELIIITSTPSLIIDSSLQAKGSWRCRKEAEDAERNLISKFPAFRCGRRNSNRCDAFALQSIYMKCKPKAIINLVSCLYSLLFSFVFYINPVNRQTDDQLNKFSPSPRTKIDTTTEPARLNPG